MKDDSSVKFQQIPPSKGSAVMVYERMEGKGCLRGVPFPFIMPSDRGENAKGRPSHHHELWNAFLN